MYQNVKGGEKPSQQAGYFCYTQLPTQFVQKQTCPDSISINDYTKGLRTNYKVNTQCKTILIDSGYISTSYRYILFST